MKIKIRVNVTADHIRHGQRNDSFYCPIALALGQCGLGRVSVDKVSFEFLGSGFHTFLPIKARRFVKNFDKSSRVKPFTFSFLFQSEKLS